MRLALYQPEIAPNAGAVMRLCACLGAGLDIIEPCGFILDDARLRRAGMDYIDMVDRRRHVSFAHFLMEKGGSRLVLLTTRADLSYAEFSFRPDDILLLGRESAGVPDNVWAAADVAIRIPLRPGARSLNVAMAAAIVLGEATRQLGGMTVEEKTA
jgi:tRNA (cytidine/uridine-2'-O-)-methyltransferase